MNEYVLGVIGSVLLSSLILSVTPNGKTSTLIKSVAKLLCVFSVLAPIFGFLGGDKSVGKIFDKTSIKEDASFIEYCSKMSIQETKSKLEEFIQKEYSLSASAHLDWEYAEITTDGLNLFSPVIYQGKGVRVKKILLTFEKTFTKEEKSQIKEELENKFSCEVEIV